jgi:hypothetical protein
MRAGEFINLDFSLRSKWQKANPTLLQKVENQENHNQQQEKLQICAINLSNSSFNSCIYIDSKK